MCFWDNECKNDYYFFNQRAETKYPVIGRGKGSSLDEKLVGKSVKTEKGIFLLGFTVENLKVLMGRCDNLFIRL